MKQNYTIPKSDDFFPYFGKEIIFDDIRSTTMAQLNTKGIVVGIRLDSVEIRICNNMTNWYSFSSMNIIFHI
jgi:hypothetical protein